MPGGAPCSVSGTANRKHKRDVEGEQAPDANEEYLIYQTLAGAWPHATARSPSNSSAPHPGLHDQGDQGGQGQQQLDPAKRSLGQRRARIHRGDPAPEKRNTFLGLFRPLAEQLAQLGAINSLSQTLIKLTAPGVPDIYQGNELWDFSLVDPDNRRPVDYEARRKALAEIGNASPEDLLANWKDGRIKLFLTHKLLSYRRDHFDLFAKGDYLPVQASGAFAEFRLRLRPPPRGRDRCS